MHTNKIKAKVDFKFCIGSIPAMLRATKPVLSERQYKDCLLYTSDAADD